jgi:AcrR family transcriptional regulator
MECPLRRKQPARLNTIVTAALAVFTRDGFASAQVADIARAAGLSVGTLYLYAESKQALFELALDAAVPGADVGRDVDVAALPLRARGPQATAARLDQLLRQHARWPVLKAALRAPVPAPNIEAEIAGVIGELFDLLSRGRALIWLLDRCAWELPQLRKTFLERMRAPYFGDLARYMTRRRGPALDGCGGHPAAVGRAVVEMVAWMAMHRTREPIAQPFDTATARQACIAVACGGLLGSAAVAR